MEHRLLCHILGVDQVPDMQTMNSIRTSSCAFSLWIPPTPSPLPPLLHYFAPLCVSAQTTRFFGSPEEHATVGLLDKFLFDRWEAEENTFDYIYACYQRAAAVSIHTLPYI